MISPSPKKIVLLSACLLLLMVTDLFSAPEGERKLEVFRSAEIEDEEALREIKGQKEIHDIEVALFRERLKQAERRAERMKRLHRAGGTSKFESDLAGISEQDASDLVAALASHGRFLESLQSELNLESFYDGPEKDRNAAPELEVRIPGLSLRVGGTDFFTVRMKAKAEVTHANKKYTAARLKENFAPPHKSIFHDLLGGRLAKLSEISSARATELERSSFYVSMVKHLQLLTNHRFASQWRKGQRIEAYNQFVESRDSMGGDGPQKKFAGSQESFWLFGDGEADAQSSSPLSTSDVYFSGRKAESKYLEQQTLAKRNAAKRHYESLVALKGKGFSNDSEIRKAQLQVDLFDLELEKVKAEQEVAKSEFEQLKAAVSSDSDFSKLIPLPSTDGVKGDAAKIWLDWLKAHPPVEAHELIRFNDLLKNRIQAGVEVKIAKRRNEFEMSRLSAYRRIPSVYAKELELQLDRVTEVQTGLARAMEEESLATLKLQQWAYRVYRRDQIARPPNPEKMIAIMEAGKAVNESRVKVARIEMLQKQCQCQYDKDYLDRLREVQKKGAATRYEVALAENEFLRSQGLFYTAMKELAIVKQQAVFVEVLYRSGSMSYDENGLAITRFMPEAGEELEKLTILKDSPDKGKILEMEARLANTKLKLQELDRLVKAGHASPVEVDYATASLQQMENRIEAEKVRGAALQHALDLVRALEFEQDPNQKLEPSDDLKL